MGSGSRFRARPETTKGSPPPTNPLLAKTLEYTANFRLLKLNVGILSLRKLHPIRDYLKFAGKTSALSRRGFLSLRRRAGVQSNRTSVIYTLPRGLLHEVFSGAFSKRFSTLRYILGRLFLPTLLPLPPQSRPVFFFPTFRVRRL